MPVYFYSVKSNGFDLAHHQGELRPVPPSPESPLVIMLTTDPERSEFLIEHISKSSTFAGRILVRVVISDDVPVITFAELIRSGALLAAPTEEMQDYAQKHCEEAEKWRFSLNAIPSSQWLAVEILSNAGEWVALDEQTADSPEALLLIRRAVARLDREKHPNVHAACDLLVKHFDDRRAAYFAAGAQVKSTNDVIANINLSYAAMNHDLESTRRERDQARKQRIDELLKSKLSFEEKRALERLRAGGRSRQDLGVLGIGLLNAIGIEFRPGEIWG